MTTNVPHLMYGLVTRWALSSLKVGVSAEAAAAIASGNARKRRKRRRRIGAPFGWDRQLPTLTRSDNRPTKE
jgi:hypothetical protein